MYDWNIDIKSAPKGATILLDVGLPFAVVGMYDAADNTFVYTSITASDEVWFENSRIKTPKAWAHIPHLDTSL